MIFSTRERARRSRKAPFAALIVGLALVILPAMAWAQGAGQYEDSSSPQAPSTPAPAPPSSSGGSVAPAPAPAPTPAAPAPEAAPAPTTEAVPVDPSTTVESLPVTGLPAVPMALAGLVMLLLGSLGLRRYSGGGEGSERGEASPIDHAVVEQSIRPRGAVSVLERISDETVESEPLASSENDPVVEDAVVVPDGPEAGVADAGSTPPLPTYEPVPSDSHHATAGRIAGAALLVAGAVGARRISR